MSGGLWDGLDEKRVLVVRIGCCCLLSPPTRSVSPVSSFDTLAILHKCQKDEM
jgi:hypothetical protein